MVGADFVKRFVGRGNAPLFLRRFLESALCILIGTLRDDGVYLSVQMLADKRFGSGKSLVEIDGADDSLKGIGEDDVAGTAGVLGFAFGKKKVFARPKRAGALGKRNRINEGGAVAREVRLRLCRIFPEKEVGCRKLKDGIA